MEALCTIFSYLWGGPDQGDKLIPWDNKESILVPEALVKSQKDCLVSLRHLDASIQNLSKCLLPFACSQEQYAEVQKTKQEEPKFFTFAHLRIIALTASILLSAKKASSVFVARKDLNIPTKVIVPVSETPALLLLPQKNKIHDLQSGHKWGRHALCCTLVNNTWNVEQVWNLTSRKKEYGVSPVFFNARSLDTRLKRLKLEHIIPKQLWDFDVSTSVKKRTTYTALHESLLDCCEKPGFLSDRARVLKLALSAAQKIGAIHAAGLVWRDCKTDNMLVSKSLEMLLCDLDDLTEAVGIGFHNFNHGTRTYLSPECLLKMPVDDKKRDVFAFGCVLHEMILDAQPAWFEEGQKRKLDQDTLARYKSFAEKAQANLEAKKATSIQKAILWLAQWAMHPEYDKRPDMQVIINYLSGTYSAEDDLTIHDLEPFLTIERTK